MFFYSITDPFQTGLDDAFWHGKVEANKAFCIIDKEGIATFKENAGFICHEIRNIFDIAQVWVHIDPGKVGGFRDIVYNLRKFLGEEAL